MFGPSPQPWFFPLVPRYRPSPGFQRLTLSPTFQTIPLASLPPMWWSNYGWESKTDTGLPSEAQTLFKFNPAALTMTNT